MPDDVGPRPIPDSADPRARREDIHIYIVGGGLAGLASAVYLIRDGGIAGEKITIFEELDHLGGSLDGFASKRPNSFFMRGFRMLEDHVYSALFDLMQSIPLPDDPDKSLYDDFIDFNREVQTCSQSRLIENGRPMDARPLRLHFMDRIRLLKLLLLQENQIEQLEIADYFSSGFFFSNFWYEFATTFSFQPWHSLEEFKRYVLRFIQDAPVLDTQTCIRSTRFNQYESIVLPIQTWLLERGVVLQERCVVTAVELDAADGGKVGIGRLSVESPDGAWTVPVSPDDLVLLTLGSMTAEHANGSLDEPPRSVPGQGAASWRLWEQLARVSPEFGRPAMFNAAVERTKWVSFTATFTDPLFFRRIEEITRKRAGTEGPVTIKDSSWLISFGLPNQPHFLGQPADLTVFWGYGLRPDAVGDFVPKRMVDCSGREVLTELIRHLRLDADQEAILRAADCIPCLLPFITSQFMPRKAGDRPLVVPGCARNFALIGQYCEIPKDIVFTLEYSVRSAQLAVYQLLGLTKEPTRIYQGQRDPLVVWNTIRTAFR